MKMPKENMTLIYMQKNREQNRSSGRKKGEGGGGGAERKSSDCQAARQRAFSIFATIWRWLLPLQNPLYSALHCGRAGPATAGAGATLLKQNGALGRGLTWNWCSLFGAWVLGFGISVYLRHLWDQTL